MQMIIVIGGLAGFILGLRFKVFVLVPSIGLALTAIAVAGMGRGAGWVALAMVAAAISIQIGYLIGSVTIHAIAAGRARVAQSAAFRSLERVRGVMSR